MRSVVVAAALLAPLAVPTVASAQILPYQPPVVSLVSDDSSITATITNPNDRGICSLSIGINSSMALFVDGAAWPEAGQTVTLTRDGLAPGLYRGNGFCGTPAPNSTPGAAWVMGQMAGPVSFEIWVGPEPKPEPVGSLMFGS